MVQNMPIVNRTYWFWSNKEVLFVCLGNDCAENSHDT